MHFTGVSLLWAIFLVFFVVMAVRETLAAKRGLAVPTYDLGFPDMNEAQEILRQAIIQADRSSHRIAAWSYGSAGTVAAFSMVLSVVSH